MQLSPPKFSLSDQPVPIGEDLAPAQDPDRFPKAGRPERVGSVELLNGLEAVGLYEPEATRGSAGVAIAKRSRSSNC